MGGGHNARTRGTPRLKVGWAGAGTRQARGRHAAGDAAGGAAGSSSQPPKHATARHPFLTAASFGRTHPGGFKPSDARNQDTFFELRMDEHNAGQ